MRAGCEMQLCSGIIHTVPMGDERLAAGSLAVDYTEGRACPLLQGFNSNSKANESVVILAVLARRAWCPYGTSGHQ